MVEEDPSDEFPSEPPSSGGPKEHVRESVRSRLESIIPEILKRAVEIGVEKARESPDNLKQFVNDLKVPKEIAHLLFQQIDDTKNGVFRVVAKEMRDFLEHTNFAGELQKLLTTVQFEVNTTIRFTPNDGREPRKSDGDGNGQDPEGGGEGDTKTGERSGSSPPPSRHPFKPEVKTSVKMHRDDRAARPRGRRGSQGA